MKVLLMPSNVDGNGYYRCLYPGKQLARLGHEVGWVPHSTIPGRHFELRYEHIQNGQVYGINQFLLGMEFDTLFMGQRSEPWLHKCIRQLRSQGKRVVVDCDDDWITSAQESKAGFKAGGYNPGSRKPKQEVDAMLAQLNAASAITVSTPQLSNLYGQVNEDVTVIRNALDWDMWADINRLETRKVRVGWMGELYWRRGDLDILRGVIGPWLEQNPEVEFVAAGDPQVHDYLGIPERQRVSVAPTQFWWFDLPDITATFDVGLVPLAKNLLNEGKSHLKGMEYNACGIPYIASPSESYRWFTDGNGLLASSPQEWRKALDLLVGDSLLRKSMSRRGRELAEHHSIQERAREWESVVCVPDRDSARQAVAA